MLKECLVGLRIEDSELMIGNEKTIVKIAKMASGNVIQYSARSDGRDAEINRVDVRGAEFT
jgi:hypothetical protein